MSGEKRPASATGKTVTKKVKTEPDDLNAIAEPRLDPLFPPDKILDKFDFWAIIERAWGHVDSEINIARLSLVLTIPQAKRSGSDWGRKDTPKFKDLEALLRTCTAEQLVQWETILARVLDELGTVVIHKVLGGDGPSFQARCAYAVALGKTYYDALRAKPKTYGHRERAGLNYSCYRLLSIGTNILRTKPGYADWTPPPQGISKASFTKQYIGAGRNGNLSSDDEDTQYGIAERAIQKNALSDSAAITPAVFWGSFEAAWSGIGRADTTARSRLAVDNIDKERRQVQADRVQTDKMVKVLRSILERYSQAQLVQWHTHLNYALFNLDREDLFERLEVSEHAFLGCRCFIVACGKKYYDAVLSDPATFATYQWSEDLTRIAADVMVKEHGDDNKYNEIIPLVTGSNKAMWPKRYAKNT